jgi:hypothetical protein
MKGFSLLIVFCLCVLSIKAQYPSDSSNFYHFLEDFSNDRTKVDTFEGSEFNQTNRMAQFWGPRLYPHGKFSISQQAMSAYAQSVAMSSSSASSSFTPNWTSLGPFNNGGSTDGMGQIHCLAFHPSYDGLSNQTIYAGTPFGGLWVSYNGGGQWSSLGTDQLPVTSVSDIAIDPTNPNTIYISTGLGDNMIYQRYRPNDGVTNPIHTIGIYKTDDHGVTWENVSLDMLNSFTKGTAIRRIVLNPNNSNEMIAATSSGIYKSSNLNASSPSWVKVFEGFFPDYDSQFKGLEYNTSQSGVLYASGVDIYSSTDNGLTWQSMTGSSLGLDLTNLSFVGNQNNQVQIKSVTRINIAVCNSNSNILYAYLLGRFDYVTSSGGIAEGKCGFIYRWDGNQWMFLDSQTNIIYATAIQAGAGAQSTSVTEDRMPIAVSHTNENHVAYGAAVAYGSPDVLNAGFSKIAGYNNVVHADFHALEFEPISNSINLFAGTDGGVSKKVSAQGTGNWQNLYNGLEVAKIWTFDDSELNDKIALTAHQDCGTFFMDKDNTVQWGQVMSLDGYGARINDDKPTEMFGLKNKIYKESLINIPPSFNDVTPPSLVRVGFPMVNHPETRELLIALRDVCKRNIGGVPAWEQISDLGLLPTYNSITEFIVSEVNPDVMYIANFGADHTDWEQDANAYYVPKLLKSTSGGFPTSSNPSGFEMLSFSGGPGLGSSTDFVVSPSTFYPITSIAIDPSNPEKVWIGFANYDASTKVWYSDDGGITWVNDDPNFSIPLPVNSLVYQKGTNDRIYAGTDAGIYTKDANSDWEKYGDDFPNVRVTEMKINYCAGKLRASTYGRGLWEGDLVESDLPAIDNIVSSDQVWDTERSVTGTLFIENGNTLTLKSTVVMGVNSRIIVDRGATLILDGCTLTNNCQRMWKGIEVWGDQSQSQNSSIQGKVISRNGTLIEHAKAAIVTYRRNLDGTHMYGYRGGIIQVRNTTFRNNSKDVAFSSYHNYNSNGSEIPNESFFINSNFVIDDDLNEPLQSIRPNVTLWDVSGVKFKGNTFADYRMIESKRTGVLSVDASYIIDELCSNNSTYPPPFTCNANNSNFIGLKYGVQAFGNGSLNSIIIKNTHFDTYNGVYLSGVDNLEMLKNDFNTDVAVVNLGQSAPYSLYLDGCSQYHVEANTFHSNAASYNTGGVSAGLLVNNGTPFDEEIYRNTFNGYTVAIEAIGNNKDPNSVQGLEFRCNDFSDNETDIFVTEDWQNPVGGTPNMLGVAESQGFAVAGQPKNLANNLFGINSTISSGHLFNNVSGSFVNYETADFVVEPRLNPNSPSINFNSFPETRMCPSKLQNLSVNDLHQTAQNELIDYNNVSAIINTMVDNGNTSLLQIQVEQLTTADAMTMYMDLLSISPYLSDEVLVEVASQEQGLTLAMIRDILEANYQAAKSEEIQNVLDERINLLPQYMRDQIDVGLTEVSLKDYLDYKQSYHNGGYKLAIDEMSRILVNDTMQNNTSHLVSLFDSSMVLAHKYQLVKLYDDNGDSLLAESVLQDIALNFELREFEITDYEDFQQLRDLKYELAQQDSILNSQKDVLVELLSHSNWIAAYSRSLLKFYDVLDYQEPVYFPTIVASRESNTTFVTKDHNKLYIYPNPSAGVFHCVYRCVEWYGELELVISDFSGKEVFNKKMNSPQDEVLVSVNLSPGVYNCSLISNNRTIQTEKLIIAK